MTPTRVVCVLSGGGAKTGAHVGTLRALAEFDITPHHIVATSMGAVIGACFAAGMTYEDVLERILLLERGDVAVPSTSLLLGPFATSLLRPDRLRETIATLVPARRFQALTIPLTVTAVDAENGQLTLFGSGGRAYAPLVDALAASCALPIYYPPVEIAGRRYVDGGLRAVLPLDVARRFEPDLVVAAHVGPWLLDEPPPRPAVTPPLLQAHNRAMRILMGAQAEDTLARWRDGSVPLVFVKTTATQAATFDIDGAALYVGEGYRATVRALHHWIGSDLSGELAPARAR